MIKIVAFAVVNEDGELMWMSTSGKGMIPRLYDNWDAAHRAAKNLSSGYRVKEVKITWKAV